MGLGSCSGELEKEPQDVAYTRGFSLGLKLELGLELENWTEVLSQMPAPQLTYWLGDLGKVTYLQWASVFSSIKWG